MKHGSLALLKNASMALLFSIGMTKTSVGQHPSTDLSEVSLEQLGRIQVYSASRHLQSSADAPSSVTVITADQIQEQGYRTLADALRTVRSFFVTYDRNYSSLGVRGFARPGDFNTRILLLVDGHRLNDEVYDEAMIGTEFPIDIELIQRIEIIRGPVSSLYGSNALFAVINIITKQADDLNGAELSSEAGSFNTYQGRISYGQQFDKLRFVISGSFYGSRGHNQLFFPEFDSNQTNNGIASHADDDQVGSAIATFAFHGFTLQSVYGTREKGIPTAAYGTIFNNPGTRTTDSHGYIDLQYNHTYFDSWNVLARTFYDRYTYEGTYMYPSPLNPLEVSPNIDSADGKWWGAELQIVKTVVGINRVTMGGEYRDNLRQDQGNFNLNPYSLALQDRRKSFVGAIFVQDEVALTKAIALNAGFRYDYYSTVRASKDPRAALIYHPGADATVKLVYGEAFRIPNVYEKYYSIPPNAPNPSLNPEKLRSTEVVWEQGLPGHFWFSMSAFHNTMDDLITQSPFGNGLFIYRNLQKVESDGIELEIKGQTPRGFEGSASYSFQETKDRDSHQFLDNSPRTLFKINAIEPLAHRSLFASMDAQYRSGMTTFTGSPISPFIVVNASLLGRRIGRRMDLSASLYNLMNKKYYDPPSTGLSESAVQQDGRNVLIEMTWHLGER
jgi:outer membrane receptor for ferrienterochelin and colicins